MRNWYFNDELNMWFGEIFEDEEKIFPDGFLLGIRSRIVKEVNICKEVSIMTLKSGEKFFMVNSRKFKRDS